MDSVLKETQKGIEIKINKKEIITKTDYELYAYYRWCIVNEQSYVYPEYFLDPKKLVKKNKEFILDKNELLISTGLRLKHYLNFNFLDITIYTNDPLEAKGWIYIMENNDYPETKQEIISQLLEMAN